MDFGIFKGWVQDTKEINAACGAAFGAACDGDVPSEAFGYLMTFAVHLPELMKVNTIHDVIPYIRYQKIRPQDEVGEGATVSEKANWDVLTIGVAYKPHPNVALKMAYRENFYGGTEAAGAKPGDAGTEKQYFDLGLAYQY